jgi:hypothetical protein
MSKPNPKDVETAATKQDAKSIADKLRSFRAGAKGFADQTLKDVNNAYAGFRKDYVDGPLSEIESVVNIVGDSVDAIVGGATTGVLESEVFPKDFARELCFRMDFFEYDRSARFEKAKKHPKATVILPLPRNIGTQTAIGYSSESLGTGGIIENAVRNSGGIPSGGDSIDQLKAIAANLGSGASAVGESLGLKAINALSEGTVGAIAGFTPNPHLATLFTGMDMRSFNFTIQCTSSSPEDSAALHNIINMMKKYALPAISEKRISLAYPHEVFISFSEAGYANPPRTPLDNIFRFKRCVLKGININVGSQGTPSFFNNLEPTELTIDLEFTETEIETANDYGAAGGEDLSKKVSAAATDAFSNIGQSATDAKRLAASSDKEGS